MALPPQTTPVFEAGKRPQEERQPAAEQCRVDLRDNAFHGPGIPQAGGGAGPAEDIERDDAAVDRVKKGVRAVGIGHHPDEDAIPQRETGQRKRKRLFDERAHRDRVDRKPRRSGDERGLAEERRQQARGLGGVGRTHDQASAVTTPPALVW